MKERETVLIQKIKENSFISKQDVIAVEHCYEIPLRSGEKICGTCTPTHVEELILGRRFLENDFTQEEMEKYQVKKQEKSLLQLVSVDELFHITELFFEKPGSLFADTGCAHSCALIYEGKMVCQIEDIGRYNALDKVIGYAIKHQIPFSGAYVFASGRIAREYMQKVIAVGFPMVASRAAVTSEALRLAKQENITLLGFMRKNSGNIFNEGKVKINEQSR